MKGFCIVVITGDRTHFFNKLKHMEEWKDIEGCEGLFQASTEGRIKRVETSILTKRGIRQVYKEKIYKPWVSPDGYGRVFLPRRFHKTILVHKLIAETFIPIPAELEQYIGTQNLQINHKDENKLNNNVENLEWCTARYNSNYGTRNERMGLKLKGRKPSDNTIKASVERSSKTVYQYTLEGELISIYPSASEAARQVQGVYSTNISHCCNGKLKSTGGFIWSHQLH